MVIKTYKIKNPPVDLYDYFLTLANRIDLNTRGGEIEISIDHIDATDETNFQSDLGKRLGILIDGGSTNIAKFIDEIKTDQLFFTTEFAVTKTNIGSTYTNVFTDFAGRPFFIDTTGFTKMAIQILWTKVGTGTQTLRIVEDVTSTQILESPSLVTGSNDFADVAIPQGALNFKGRWRLQVKSTVAADDPVFGGMRVYLRR